MSGPVQTPVDELMTPLTAALVYARRGWLVFPIKPRQKVPATRHGYLDATTEPDQIRKWWSGQGREQRNIGIVTSPKSGIWVLDCDVDKVTGEPIGEATLVELTAKHGTLLPHPIARTPHGGQHHVFAWPTDGDLARTIGFLPGLDALGSRKDEKGKDAGGYFVVWPSKTAVGAYTWGVSPKQLGVIPQAPQWLLDIIRAKASTRPPEMTRIKPVRAEKTNAYGRAALTEICDEVASCPPGSQDDTLYRKAVRIGSIVAHGDIDEHEAFTSLVDAGMRMMNGDASRPWTQREVADKVRRGMAYGARDPYTPRQSAPPPPNGAGRLHDEAQTDREEVSDPPGSAEEVSDPLDGLVERTAADAGAAFAPEVLERLVALRRDDRTAFEGLRAQLKKAGCRVTALDEAIAEENGDGGGRGPTQADILLDLAHAAELFHAPDRTGFADVEVEGHRETWPIRSKGFKRWLSRCYFKKTAGAPSSEALQAALNVIEAMAHFDAPERVVHVRVAGLVFRL